MISDKNTRNYFGEPDDTVITFSSLSYFHLYYQFNIYNGIFNVFCVVMYVIYRINQRNHRHEMEELLEAIEEYNYYAQGDEDPCSICLASFEKEEKIYKLNCSHMFHTECLEHWLEQQFTCPLCRADIAEGLHHPYEGGFNNHDIWFHFFLILSTLCLFHNLYCICIYVLKIQ